jgi:hypothetical protein
MRAGQWSRIHLQGNKIGRHTEKTWKKVKVDKFEVTSERTVTRNQLKQEGIPEWKDFMKHVESNKKAMEIYPAGKVVDEGLVYDPQFPI